MRAIVALAAVLVLSGCDQPTAEAKKIVINTLGGPTTIEFRKLTTSSDKTIVCGEVMATDKPEGGWRRFVAYLQFGRAVVMPSYEVPGAEAEMGNPLLKGEYGRFLAACD